MNTTRHSAIRMTESEVQAPMAMVIMFGLLSSTALNMIVVPILYDRFGRAIAGRVTAAQ
jgi:Cu/Ag efflux pump CusA